MRAIIDDKYLIDIDDRNFVLKERMYTEQEDGTLKEYLRTEGYFINVGFALRRLIQIRLHRSESVVDLEGLIKEYEILAEYVKQKTDSAQSFEREQQIVKERVHEAPPWLHKK